MQYVAPQLSPQGSMLLRTHGSPGFVTFEAGRVTDHETSSGSTGDSASPDNT